MTVDEYSLRRKLAYGAAGVSLSLVAMLGSQLAKVEREAAEAQRKVDRETLRTELVVASSPSAILMCDDEGRIVLANFAAETMLGYIRCELLAMHSWQLVPESEREEHELRLRDAVERMLSHDKGDWMLLMNDTDRKVLTKESLEKRVRVSIRAIRFMGEVQFVVSLQELTAMGSPHVPIDGAVPLPEFISSTIYSSKVDVND